VAQPVALLRDLLELARRGAASRPMSRTT